MTDTLTTPAPKERAKRRPFDFYETAPWQTKALLERLPVDGTILECCSGDDSIANVLRERAGRIVLTNDIDPARPSTFHLDATRPESWEQFPAVDWVVTNPPFNKAIEIVKLSHRYARKGVAMLLRLTFLEPTRARRDFLGWHPPAAQIVLPRYSYTGNGKTDSVTTAWLLWPTDAMWFETYYQRPAIDVVREAA